jgi:hypothetical protein
MKHDVIDSLPFGYERIHLSVEHPDNSGGNLVVIQEVVGIGWAGAEYCSACVRKATKSGGLVTLDNHSTRTHKNKLRSGDQQNLQNLQERSGSGAE